jgi:hypothetical protein
VSADLRDRLSAIDPVQHLQAYTSAEQARLVQQIIATGESRAPVAIAAKSQQNSVRPRRRVLMSLSAAATAGFAVTLLTQGLPHESSAATVTGPAPAGTYLHTRTRLKVAGVNRVTPEEAIQGARSYRYVDTSTIQSWRGTTCNDRVIETRDPLVFPSVADRQAALARAREQAYLRPLIDGVTTTWEGADLRNLDDVPCDRLGTVSHPNPPYLATYPTTADAFLAKVRGELAADAEATDIRVEEGLMGILETPWLSDLQRAAGLRAFAQVPGRWKVSGTETVAGIRGLRVVRSEPGTGTREELVLAGRAPGVLRRTETLIDPATADPVNRIRLEGLEPGTVMYDRRVLTVDTVAQLPTKN